jgi:cleavage and polyadenylation specificity factor subunit 1
MMDRIFAELPFTFVYLDDVLVVSPTAAAHHRHLRATLDQLRSNGLLINSDKCTWGATTVEFLGHTISAVGISPVQQRLAAIQAHPQPRTIRDVQGYLGLFNFYRRFVPAAAAIIKPLTDIL